MATPTNRDGQRVRLSEAVRTQSELQVVDLESLIPADHPVRAVWQYVCGLDLRLLYADIRAVEGRAGSPAIDPRILLTLWLFATLDGVGSGRALARLCERDIVYRWICGGVSVNYHTLSDFRVGHGDFLDGLLTRSVAGLTHEGLVTMNTVAQDGMRVRAGAGAGSFRRQPSLEESRRQAVAQVQRLKDELESDPSGASARVKASQQRAAVERLARIEQALKTAKIIEAEADAKASGKAQGTAKGMGKARAKELRVSTTDPDARVMKMGDGGFRPAFNVQFATDVETQVIVGADVTNIGSDQREAASMIDQLQERYNRLPERYLVDGGFVNHDDIEALGNQDVEVYAPLRKPTKSKQNAVPPTEPRRSDPPHVARWRQRMQGDDAKAIYKQRAATAECVNALARNRGLLRYTVRGIAKVWAVSLWYALAHNLMRSWRLSASQPAAG